MAFLSPKRIVEMGLLRLDRWCEKTGRKLVIANTQNGEPTLLRYSLFPTKSSPTSPSREPRWGNLYIHKFLRSEDFDLHDHPWSFISFLLKGTYQEILPNNQTRTRGAGSVNFFPARWIHSVKLEPGATCWTFVIRGPHTRQWGYHTNEGWIPARTYLARVKRPEIQIIDQRPKPSSGPLVQDRWRQSPARVLLIGDDGLICPHMADHFMDYHPTTELFVLSRGEDAERIRDSSRFERQQTANKVQLLSYSSSTITSLHEMTDPIDTVIYLDAHTPSAHTSSKSLVTRGSLDVLQALETSTLLNAKRFTLVSSGEVHGALHRWRPYRPTDRTKPLSLNRASLVGAEALVQAWSENHEGVFNVVRTPEVFGERTPLDRIVGQFLEQLLTRSNVHLRNRKNTRGQTVLSTHQYLHARDTARAILHATMNGASGEIYHLAGKELDDLELVERLSSLTGLHPKIELSSFSQRTDGHRFALEETLGKELHWKAPHGFEVSIRNTVEWMLRSKNQRWLQAAK